MAARILMSDQFQASFNRAQAAYDRQEPPEPDNEEERLQRQLDEADRKLDIEREDEI
jgi:hypothetical protein